MAGKTRASIALAGLVLASGGSLTQCGRDLGREVGRQWLPDRSYEAHLQEGFGPVSRREIGRNDEGGARLEVRVTSTAEKSWMDAQILMLRKAGCGEGRSFSQSHESPAVSWQDQDVMDLLESKHPPRTTFVLELHCEGPLPGEFTVEPGTSPDETLAMAVQQLGAADIEAADGVDLLTATRTLSEEHPKYKAFNEMLGIWTKMAFGRCKGAAILEDVAVTTLPPEAGLDSKWNTGALVMAADFACATHGNMASSSLPPDATSTP